MKTKTSIADIAPKRVRKLQIKVLDVHFDRESRHLRHAHQYLEILCLLEGRRSVITRRGRFEAGPGDLIVFYPHEIHEEISPAGRLMVIVLRFPQPQLGHKLRFPEKRETPLVISLPWPERFQRLFEQMMLENEIDDAWSDAMNKAHMVAFVVLLRRAFRAIAEREPKAPDEKTLLIENVVKHIHDDLSQKIMLDELARRHFVSKSKLSHVFKHIIGMSPKSYHLRTRISKARKLLATTDRSIKAIATELGYLDEHYFSRVFKRLTGTSPKHYRAQIKKVH